ncbi:MAG: iron ABC transporter permease [Megasphaera sp.]|jgi:iron(III) transport system permease protein|nr:iron ABC transporter permease [Megasphaera sp.]MCI1247435.1 iron ABC transporter permease [Megasphaera sp.]
MIRQHDGKHIPVLASLEILLLFLIVCPLITIFIKAVIINDRLDFSLVTATLMESDNITMIVNSIVLGLWVVVISTLIAIPLAYLFSRTTFAKYKFFDIIFLIPFMTPPYIASMGWILCMQKRGLLGQLCPTLFSDGIPAFFTLAGLVLVMSLHVFPFMMILMKNAMLHVPASLEESATIFGAGFIQRMRKIFFPLLTGNYVIGALLVFVKTLSEYGTPYTLGRRIGYAAFTTDIHRYAAIAPISFGKAAVLSSVLITICLLLWVLQNYITTHRSYNLINGKGSAAVIHPLPVLKKYCAWIYIVVILFIAIGIPYFSVITTSLIHLRGYGIAAGNFTFSHYYELFTSNTYAIQALTNSLFLAVTAATIGAAAGTLIVLAVRRYRHHNGKVLEAVSLLPEMLPGIVLVIGIMLFWNDIYDILPVYNTMGIMIITYVVLFLPYSVQYVTSSFTQINASLLTAGQVFGGSHFYIFRKITLPLILKGVAAGWMMTFIISIRELVAPSLIAPPNVLVISTFIMREFEQGSVSLGMALAALCVAFTVIPLLVLNKYIDTQYKA